MFARNIVLGIALLIDTYILMKINTKYTSFSFEAHQAH